MKTSFIKIAALLLLHCINYHSSAQVQIGVKGGFSIPNLSSGSNNNPVSTGYSSRLGAAAAMFASYDLYKHFSIQTQLEYSAQGGKKNGLQAIPMPHEMQKLFPEGQAPAYLYANYKSTARLNYLKLPVLAKFTFKLNGRYFFYANGGPFVGYLLNAKNVTSGSSSLYLDENGTQALPGTQQSFDHTNNVTNDIHRINTGVEASTGLIVCTDMGNFMLEAGVNYGFKNIQKDAANGKNHTGAASIMLGYSIPLIGNGFRIQEDENTLHQ